MEINKLKKILIIKHGAFGDFIQALGAFSSIRSHYGNDAQVDLITISSLQKIGQQTGYFNNVFIDNRKSLFTFDWIRVIFLIRKYDVIFDLQTSQRTNLYFKLTNKSKNKWCGIAPGCEYCHKNINRGKMYAPDRFAEQIKNAGIEKINPIDISFLTKENSKDYIFKKDECKKLKKTPYALIIPGTSAHRLEKQWGIDKYINLARSLLAHNIMPVFIGGKAEEKYNDIIKKECPTAVNLIGKTDFADLSDLGRCSKLNIGGDTGPMHLIASLKKPCYILFCTLVKLTKAPKSENVRLITNENLANISLQDVEKEIYSE